jgi:hypothetical protein
MVKNKKNPSSEEKFKKSSNDPSKLSSTPKSTKSTKTPTLEFDLSSIPPPKPLNLDFSSSSKKRSKPNQEDDQEAPDRISKPGQKHPEPGLDDPLRAFYESLYEQNPKSQMAQKYCLENGLLSEETARKLQKLRLKKG